MIRFRLFDVPVSISWSILLVLGFLGYGTGDLVVLAMWVLIGVASIVVHELGHALVARAGGATPTIELAGLGGVTRYEPVGRSGRRGWRLAVSLAGPGVGIAVGVLALVVRGALDAAPGSYVDAALRITLFTSFGWSIFNLLPILPLDGGQALRQLLPGDDVQRTERVAWVGVATSVVVVGLSVYSGQLFLALFGGLFAAQNYQTASGVRTASRQRAALRELVQGRQWRALRDVLADGGGDVGTAAAAQVGAAEDDEHQLAAEIGEIALGRGAEDPGFTERTAAAWRELGMLDRAARVEAGPDTTETP